MPIVPLRAALAERFEQFNLIRTVSSEQHVELRASRKSRDMKDVDKFYAWISEKVPFSERDQLVSLASGCVGDSTTNCIAAVECGQLAMSKMIGRNFGDVKLKRTDKVRSLASLSSGIPVNNEIVAVNAMTLFNRIICVVQTSHERSEIFQFELAPQPLSLFDSNCMRKGHKAELCKVFDEKVQCTAELPNERLKFVVDGGFLLHRVIWSVPSTYKEICDRYVAHVINKYSQNATVVFDGYESSTNTKDAEHRRRAARGSSSDVIIEETMVCLAKPVDFLANTGNKVKLITLLSQKLRDRGVSVWQAKADADVLIVSTAIDLANVDEHPQVVIVGEDTDLVVLLTSGSCSRYMRHSAFEALQWERCEQSVQF